MKTSELRKVFLRAVRELEDSRAEFIHMYMYKDELHIGDVGQLALPKDCQGSISLDKNVYTGKIYSRKNSFDELKHLVCSIERGVRFIDLYEAENQGLPTFNSLRICRSRKKCP